MFSEVVMRGPHEVLMTGAHDYGKVILGQLLRRGRWGVGGERDAGTARREEWESGPHRVHRYGRTSSMIMEAHR